MQHSEQQLISEVAVLKTQMMRIVSDIESEKETRARSNADIYNKLEKITEGQDRTNRILYMMVGGLMALQVALQLLGSK